MNNDFNNRELETFNNELGDFNLEDELRELDEVDGPIESTSDVMEGITDAIEPTRVITTGLDNLVRRLPGDVGASISDVSYSMYDVESRISSSMDRLRNTSSGFLSTLKDILPESVATHIEKLRSYLSGEESTSEKTLSEDDKIKQEVESIFSTVANAVQSTAVDKLSDITVQEDLLRNIAINAEFIKNYLTNFSSIIGKRSLELQIKSVLTQVKQYEAFKQYSETTVKQFEAIVRNTSMSDFQKESLSDYIQKRLTGSAYSASGNLFLKQSKISKIMENIGSFIEDKINTITSKLEMGSHTLDFIATSRDAGITPLYLVSNMMAEAVADGIIDRGTARIYENVIANDPVLMREAVKVANDPEIMIRKAREKIEKDVEEYRNELNQRRQQAEEEGQNPERAVSLGEKIKLRGMEARLKAIKTIENLTQTNELTETYSVSAYGNLFERGTIDNKFKKAVEITIPGFLAKILQEVRAIRKGSKKVTDNDYEYYDYGRDKWVTKSEIKKELKRDISTKVSKVYKEVYNSGLVKEFIKEYKPNKREKYELVKGIVEYLLDGKTTNVWFLKDEGIIDYLRTPGLKEAFNQYLTSFENSTNEDEIRDKVELSDELKRIKYNIDNFSNVSKSVMESNLFDIAKELGLTSESSPTETTLSNIKKLYLRRNREPVSPSPRTSQPVRRTVDLRKDRGRNEHIENENSVDVEVTTEEHNASDNITNSDVANTTPNNVSNTTANNVVNSAANRMDETVNRGINENVNNTLINNPNNIINNNVRNNIINNNVISNALNIMNSSVNNLESSVELIRNREVSEQTRELVHNEINRLELSVIETISTILNNTISDVNDINEQLIQRVDEEIEEFFTQLLRMFIKRVEKQEVVDAEFIADRLELFVHDILDVTYYNVNTAVNKIANQDVEIDKIEEVINEIITIIINKIEDVFSDINIEIETKTIIIKTSIDVGRLINNIEIDLRDLDNSNMFKDIVNKVKEIIKSIKEKVSKILSNLKDLFNNTFAVIADTFKRRMGNIRNIKREINNFLSNTYNNVTNFIGDLFNKIKLTVNEYKINKNDSLFKNIRQSVKKTFTDIFSLFKDRIEEFTNYISDIDLKNKFVDMFKASKAKLLDIVSSVTNTIEDFGFDISKVGEKLKDMYTATMNQFDTTITAVKNRLNEMIDIDRLKDKASDGYANSIDYIRNNISPRLADTIKNITDRTTGAINNRPRTKEELLATIEAVLKTLPDLPKNIKEKLINTHKFIKEKATDNYIELLTKIEEVNPQLADFLLNKPIEIADVIGSSVNRIKEFSNNVTDGKIDDSIDMFKSGINYSVNEVKAGVLTIANRAKDAIPELTSNLSKIKEIINKKGVSRVIESALSRYPLPTDMYNAEQLYKEVITTIDPTGRLWNELSTTPRIIEQLYKIHAEVIEKKQEGLIGSAINIVDSTTERSVSAIGKLRDMIINALPEPLKGVASRLLNNSLTRFLGKTVRNIKNAGIGALKTTAKGLKVIGREGARLFIDKDGRLTLPNLYKLGKFGVRAYTGSMRAVSEGLKEFYPALFSQAGETARIVGSTAWRLSGIPRFTRRATGRLKALIKPPIDRRLYNAWRKGELTAREVLNLLPDEEKEIWLEWLKENTPPGITLPSLLITSGRGMFELMFGTSRVVRRAYPVAGEAGMRAAQLGARALWSFSGVKDAWRDVRDATRISGGRIFDTLLSFIPDDLIDIIAGDMELAIKDIKPRNETLKSLQDDIDKLPEEIRDRAKSLLNEIVGLYENFKVTGDTGNRERGLSKIYELITLLNEHFRPRRNRLLDRLYNFAYREDSDDDEEIDTSRPNTRNTTTSRSEELANNIPNNIDRPTLRSFRFTTNISNTIPRTPNVRFINEIPRPISDEITEDRQDNTLSNEVSESNRIPNNRVDISNLAANIIQHSRNMINRNDTIRSNDNNITISNNEREIESTDREMSNNNQQSVIKEPNRENNREDNRNISSHPDFKRGIEKLMVELSDIKTSIKTKLTALININKRIPTSINSPIGSLKEVIINRFDKLNNILNRVNSNINKANNVIKTTILSVVDKLKTATKKFNPFDNDGDGDRDGNWKDRLKKLYSREDKSDDVEKETSNERKEDSLLTKLLKYFPLLLIAVKGIGKLITKAGSMLLSGLSGLLRHIPDKILTGIKWLGGLLAGGVGGAIGWIKNNGESIINKVKEFGSSSVDKIKSVATSAATGISSLFNRTTETPTRTSVNIHTSNIASNVSNPTRTTGVVGETVNRVSDRIKSASKAAEEATKKIANKAPSSVKSLVSKIKDAIPMLKKTISKKLGSRALAKVTSTIATRFVPILGTALLVKDAVEIGKYLLEGKGLLSALSLTYLGSDIYSNENEDNDKDSKKADDVKEKITDIENSNKISNIDKAESVEVIKAIEEDKINKYHTGINKDPIITSHTHRHINNVDVKPDDKSYKTLEEQKMLLHKNTTYTVGIYQTLNKIAKLQESLINTITKNKITAINPFNKDSSDKKVIVDNNTKTNNESSNTINTNRQPKIEPVPQPSLSTTITDF